MKNKSKEKDKIETLEIIIKHLENQHVVLKQQYEKTTEKYLQILYAFSKTYKQLQQEITERKKAEEALKKAHDKLEIRVQERTADLEKANEELKIEIAKREQAEQGNKESEQRYQRITEAVTDYIFTAYIENGVPVKTVHSPTCVAVTGYTAEDFSQDTYLWINMVHEKDRAAVKEQIFWIFSGHDVQPIDHRIVRKDGITRWVKVTLVPYYDTRKNLLSYDGLIHDITGRKLAEKKLQTAKEYSENLINSSLDMIISVDKDRKIMEFNRAAEKTFGYTREEVSGKHINILYAKESQGLKIHDATLKDGKFNGEILNKRKNGETFISYLSSSVLRDATDDVIGIMGISRNITERKQAEEELRKREALYFALFQYNPMETIVVDRDGKVTKSNLAKAISGDRLPQIGDVMYRDYACKHEIDMHAELMKCLRTGEVKQFPEQKYDNKFLSITLSPFPDGAIIISEDITERKLAKESLIQKQSELELMLKQEKIIAKIASQLNSTETFQDIIEEKLKYIAEEVGLKSICFHVFDPDTTQTRPLFTCSSSILCSFNPQDKTYECPFISSQIVENIKAGKIFNSSNLTELDKKDRNYLKKKDIASTFTLPIKIGKKVSGLINFSDDHGHIWNREEEKLFKTVTEIIASAWGRDNYFKARLEAEKKHSEAVQMAERSSRLASIGTLAAGISHEINQPLNALKLKVDGMLYWGERKPETLKKNLEENLRNISEQAGRINEIIKQMRVLAGQEKSKDPLPMNINKITKRVFSLMKQRMSSHGIKIIFNLDDSLPAVYGYPTQMEQVIINLLVNAINALDTLAKKDKKISITTEFAENNCVLEICDNGPGIPEENINQIFDPFFTSNVNGEGMGFGLSIIQNIITDMGGTIIASNCNESGALFKVSIPVSSKEESV